MRHATDSTRNGAFHTLSYMRSLQAEKPWLKQEPKVQKKLLIP